MLEWAAGEGRVLITQDVNTLVGVAYERVRRGEAMPGVIAILPLTPIGRAIEDILTIAACLNEGDIRNLVEYVPLPSRE